MGFAVVIAGLSAVSLLFFLSTRRRKGVRDGRPVTRRRVAMAVVIGGVLVAAGLLLFPVVWWYVSPHCCNP